MCSYNTKTPDTTKTLSSIVKNWGEDDSKKRTTCLSNDGGVLGALGGKITSMSNTNNNVEVDTSYKIQFV